MYSNREEAGGLLAEKLAKYKNDKDAVIVTIPRGGVPIGYVIAKQLNLPLEIVLSKKIGHPFHKEFAIGAVTLKNIILSPVAADVPKVYIEKETERIRNLLRDRNKNYYSGKTPLSLYDKIVILVDDGVATGNTLISCIELIEQQNPSQIVVALPVAPLSAIQKIEEMHSVKQSICLLTPENFHSVGQFYEDFSQVNDAEVIKLLKEANDNYLLMSI